MICALTQGRGLASALLRSPADTVTAKHPVSVAVARAATTPYLRLPAIQRRQHEVRRRSQAAPFVLFVIDARSEIVQLPVFAAVAAMAGLQSPCAAVVSVLEQRRTDTTRSDPGLHGVSGAASLSGCHSHLTQSTPDSRCSSCRHSGALSCTSTISATHRMWSTFAGTQLCTQPLLMNSCKGLRGQ